MRDIAFSNSRRVLAGLAGLGLLAVGCAPNAQPPTDAPSDETAPAAASSPQKVTTKTGVEMVLVPAGRFMMGNDGGDDDEKPPHPVNLSAFYIDTHEVTQAGYRKLMGKSPSKFEGPDRPVERLSWASAVQYCNMRSLREKFTPCYDAETLACDFTADGYRLPTEAEWEYACRAATATRWSFGAAAAALGKHAWFKKNAAKTTHPVGEKRPNPWGLYDMHGNVAEWCNDFYTETYETEAEATDPRGPASGKERVLRGGSWASTDAACRASARASENPGFADVCFGYETYGFRCVRRAGNETP